MSPRPFGSVFVVVSFAITAVTACSAPGETPGSLSDSAGASGTVPEELAGRSWSWTTSNGSQVLTFTATGQYTSDVFLDAHPGWSCGTEYFTHYAGMATFSERSLTLRSNVATRKNQDTCADKVISDGPIDDQVISYDWRIVDDGAGSKELVLVDSDGFEAHYSPEP